MASTDLAGPPPVGNDFGTRPAAPDDIAALEAGLDALETPEGVGPSRLRRVAGRVLPGFLAVGFLLLVWQSAVWAHVKPTYVLPSPGDVLSSLGDAWKQGSLPQAIGTSLRRGVLGFLASIAVGTPLGLVVARVRPIRLAVRPLLSGLQSLPSVAWVPAAIIWFGPSGGAIYFVILMGAVPSIANGMVSGVDQVPPLYLRVGKVLGARGLASARHVLLPAALPGYLSGLKQGWAFSWRSLMAAELIANNPKVGFGLGQLLDQGRTNLDMPLVFGAILAILVVGVAVDLLFFGPLERRVLRRRGLLTA